MGSHTSDSPTLQIMNAVRHIVQALRESGRSAERHAGISGAQLFVLHALAEAHPMTMNALALKTHTHQSSVSTVVSRLVNQGLVRRTTSDTDGRACQLSLSRRGEHLVARAPDPVQGRLIAAIERLPMRRRHLLASTLTELARAVDAVERVPLMFFEKHPSPLRSSRRAAAPRGGRIG